VFRAWPEGGPWQGARTSGASGVGHRGVPGAWREHPAGAICPVGAAAYDWAHGVRQEELYETIVSRPSRRVAASYLAFALVWFLASDLLIAQFAHDAQAIARFQTAKGLVFVFASALFILWMLRQEEHALRQHRSSDERLRAIVGGVEEHAFYLLGPDARIESYYDGSLAPAGLDGDDLVGRHLERFFVPEDRERQVPATLLRTAEETGSVEDVGWRLRADGSRHWAHCRITALRDGDGQLRGFVRVTHDITERRRAAARLETLESQVGFAQSHGRIGFFEHDLITDKVKFSDKALEIFGLPRESWVGVTEQWLKRVHPDDRARMSAALERGLHAGGQFDLDCRIVRPDGEERAVYHVVAVEQDANGKPTRTSGTIIDVTDQVRARRAAEHHRAQLAAIVGTAMDAIITTDAEQRVVQFNAAAEAMFGVSAADAIGTAIDRFIPPDARAIHRLHVERFGTSGTSARSMGQLGQVRALRADGREFPAEASISQVRLGDERFYSVILRDQTEREAARKELGESATRLHRLSLRLVRVQEQERRRLARELHDGIGQVLTAAKLRAQGSLERAPEVAAVIEDLDQILEQVRSLSLNLRPSMLDDLGLAATLRWYMNQQSALGKFEVELDLKGLEARLDPDVETAAYRIVQEAVTNVMRHAEARKVRVRAWRRDAEFELEISDDGRGFDPLARESHGGLLGMRERATLLGGSWVIHSAPDSGCIVRATLPLAADPREAGA
jgi:PAS domain S-box-containing protein